jgi:alpha-galactosidase
MGPVATKVELAHARAWSRQLQGEDLKKPPISGSLGPLELQALLESSTSGESKAAIFTTMVCRSTVRRAHHLQVRLDVREYKDFPVVEWTVFIRNTGAEPTPLFEDIHALDWSLNRGVGHEFVLNGIKGDFTTADSFEPYQRLLTPGLVERFGPPEGSGKSSDGPRGWPYFNLQTQDGGVIIAVGWPGQWTASFKRDQGGTHFKLNPGEEIRTPSITVLFWEGDDLARSQNLWRRWYRAHVLPQVEGRTLGVLSQIQVGGGDTNDAAVFLRAGIQPDLCWRDAGGASTWYPNRTGPYVKDDAWLNTGTWEIDAERYPHGFRPFTDWIHAQGMKFVLWFEPERVGDPQSWLAVTHPEWLLPGTSHGALLNEGNPAARQWLVGHVSNLIRREGVDWYREDMNGDGPQPAWRKADAPDRRGITENFYVQGHLAYWDALLTNNPGLRIDSCASGGRRNDLETMRRAVPLLRSDFQWPTMAKVIEGNQGQTYGLSSWLPFQGTGCYIYSPYALRSFYMASFGMAGLTPENTDAQRRAYAENKRVAPMMLEGDYYPLTPYSLADDQWIAWQFNRPEKGDGVVQAFRRRDCPADEERYRLQGLDPHARYRLVNFDIPGNWFATGRALMEAGVTAKAVGTPSAVIVAYERVRP